MHHGIRLFAQLALLLFLAAHGTAASAQDRWALVVGNSEYSNPSISALANTINDARTMAASLTNMGFAVYLVENATRAGLQDTLRQINAEHSGADLGFFYFAGHGIQQKGVNYMLPSDIDPKGANFLENQGIPMGGLVRDMKDTGIGKLVVVLDSCRNSPFGEDQAFGVGLALVDAPADSIIAYSTAPGAVALDGTGANSPFTAALASTLEGPQQDIRDVLKLVRAKVRHATGGAQTPWFLDNSNTEILVQPRDEIRVSRQQQQRLSTTISLASTAWSTISSSSDANDFQMFVDLFPKDALATVARDQLSLLRGSGAPVLPGMELGVPDPNPAVPGGLGVLITECDILATGIGDIFGLVEPVPHDLVNTRAALRACIQAVTNEPENMRVTALLARVLKLEMRYSEARHYFQRATELGNSAAYGGLADIYRFGLGVEEDFEKAAEYAREGALRGNAPLRLVLGNFYKQGWGVPQSFTEARRWMEIASLTGYPGALTALGDMHQRGQGVPKDPGTAMKYYRQAAASGKTDAMNNIGMAYMRGEGVEADTNQGIYWLSLGSEMGNPYSAFHLGRAFRKGWGVDKDLRQAIAFFRLSAQRNFLGAYTQIGDMLVGEGDLPADFPEAYANYTIAIEAARLRGTIAAEKNLAEADAKRNILLAKMTEDEIAAGKRIAAEWIDQYGLLDFRLVSQ